MGTIKGHYSYENLIVTTLQDDDSDGEDPLFLLQPQQGGSISTEIPENIDFDQEWNRWFEGIHDDNNQKEVFNKWKRSGAFQIFLKGIESQSTEVKGLSTFIAKLKVDSNNDEHDDHSGKLIKVLQNEIIREKDVHYQKQSLVNKLKNSDENNWNGALFSPNKEPKRSPLLQKNVKISRIPLKANRIYQKKVVQSSNTDKVDFKTLDQEVEATLQEVLANESNTKKKSRSTLDVKKFRKSLRSDLKENLDLLIEEISVSTESSKTSANTTNKEKKDSKLILSRINEEPKSKQKNSTIIPDCPTKTIKEKTKNATKKEDSSTEVSRCVVSNNNKNVNDNKSENNHLTAKKEIRKGTNRNKKEVGKQNQKPTNKLPMSAKIILKKIDPEVEAKSSSHYRKNFKDKKLKTVKDIKKQNLKDAHNIDEFIDSKVISPNVQDYPIEIPSVDDLEIKLTNDKIDQDQKRQSNDRNKLLPLKKRKYKARSDWITKSINALNETLIGDGFSWNSKVLNNTLPKVNKNEKVGTKSRTRSVNISEKNPSEKKHPEIKTKPKNKNSPNTSGNEEQKENISESIKGFNETPTSDEFCSSQKNTSLGRRSIKEYDLNVLNDTPPPESKSEKVSNPRSQSVDILEKKQSKKKDLNSKPKEKKSKNTSRNNNRKSVKDLINELNATLIGEEFKSNSINKSLVHKTKESISPKVSKNTKPKENNDDKNGYKRKAESFEILENKQPEKKRRGKIQKTKNEPSANTSTNRDNNKLIWNSINASNESQGNLKDTNKTKKNITFAAPKTKAQSSLHDFRNPMKEIDNGSHLRYTISQCVNLEKMFPIGRRKLFDPDDATCLET